MPDDLVKMAYVGASLFLFPSLAEGFGWPIAEAMASGCPVITTNKRPMTEVTKGTGRLIEKMPKEISGAGKMGRGSGKDYGRSFKLTGRGTIRYDSGSNYKCEKI